MSVEEQKEPSSLSVKQDPAETPPRQLDGSKSPEELNQPYKTVISNIAMNLDDLSYSLNLSFPNFNSQQVLTTAKQLSFNQINLVEEFPQAKSVTNIDAKNNDNKSKEAAPKPKKIGNQSNRSIANSKTSKKIEEKEPYAVESFKEYKDLAMQTGQSLKELAVKTGKS